MRAFFFIPLFIILAFSVASQTGLADESRAFIHHIDFNQASVFQNPQPWDQSNGELRFNGGDPKRDYTNLFSQKIVPDFHLEVRALWTGGSIENGLGVVFRYIDPKNYFAFQVSNEGRFRVIKMLKGIITDIIPWKCVSILAENTPNDLFVLCTGDRQRFYINNSLVAVVIDKDFSQSPVNIGVISHGDVLCNFHDLIVEGVTSSENALFTDRPSKKVDFSKSSQGFGLQPPWQIEFGRLIFYGGPENEYLNVPFDEYARPLVISVKTNWIGKSKSDGFGLVFDYKDDSSYNVFLISGQGEYQISRKFLGQWSDLIAWKKGTASKEKINILSIEYLEKSVNFSINGVVEASIPLSAFTNSGYVKTGLYSKGSVRCSFGDFSVQEITFSAKKPIIP